MNDELLRLLDQEAARRGMSRSELIRTVLGAYLAETREADLTRRIVHGYQECPPGTPDEWGCLESFSEVATRETLQRLDAEEREAGQGPW